MISMRESTIDLLLQLQKNGGLIFSTGRFPEYADGKINNPKLDELKKHHPHQRDPTAAELADKVKPHVNLSGKDAASVWTQVRTTTEGNTLLLFNTSHTNPATVSVNSPFIGENAVLWNPSDGKCYDIKPSQSGGFLVGLSASEVLWITSGEVNKTARYQASMPLQSLKQRIKPEKRMAGETARPQCPHTGFCGILDRRRNKLQCS